MRFILGPILPFLNIAALQFRRLAYSSDSRQSQVFILLL